MFVVLCSLSNHNTADLVVTPTHSPTGLMSHHNESHESESITGNSLNDWTVESVQMHDLLIGLSRYCTSSSDDLNTGMF